MAELDFEKWIERILKIMNKCESYIRMTLAEAVEKQIPKAPVWSKLQIWGCPVCGCLVHMSYCANCGQKIDWEAVDDEQTHT